MYVISKWSHKKEGAIRMRKSGYSIREVERSTGIPRSTLSGWFRHVTLSENQKRHLQSQRLKSLKHARSLATTWHKEQKRLRHELAKAEARKIMSAIDLNDVHTLKVLLSGLYMGEGAKRDGNLVLASSNPLIVRFYIAGLCQAYKVPRSRLKIELHIRADQDGESLMHFWLATLQLPKSARGSIQKDPRTKLKPTRSNYKGVCLVSGGGSAVQRELLYLGNALFEHFAK